ncbi:MAG TPA: hypothetical protein VK849_11475 [Longimicrobiales bacterium]|nr:hypothetical protein [Longimicrobiales bacterium]
MIVAPGVVRRELVGRKSSVLETLLAAPALALLAVQWRAPGGVTGPERLVLALTLLPGSRSLRYRIGEGAVRAVDDETPGRAVHVEVWPQPEAWQAAEGAGGGLTVQATVTAPGPVTLLLAGGGDDAVVAGLRAGPHLQAHATRAAADLDSGAGDVLAVRAGVPDLDQGVAWAAARVRGALAAPSTTVDPADEGAAWFWTALGALASGDEEACSALADALAGVDPGRALALLPGLPVPAGALATLIAARVGLVTGDPGAALRAGAPLSPTFLEAVRRGSDPAAWATWRLALETLADALRDAAPEPRIHALREAASAPAGRGAAVRLPMVGDDPALAPRSGTLLARLLDGGRAPDPAPSDAADPSPLTSATAGDAGPSPLERVVGAWDLLAAGDVVQGWQRWRTELTAGLDGPVGRALWDAPGRFGPNGAPVAGALLATLAHGVLGLRADAPSGRLRVAPAFPPHVRSFRAVGLRVGNVRLALDYGREGAVRRFELTPTAGRVPAMIVFEPRVDGLVRAVRIDGGGAELDTTPVEGGTRLRAQIPLDGTRVVEVEGA